MNEDFYLSALRRGRIDRRALAQALVQAGHEVSVDAFVADKRMAAGDAGVPSRSVLHMLSASERTTFERELQDLLVPLISTYLDQGMAAFANPFAVGADENEDVAGFWPYLRTTVDTMPAWAAPYAPALQRLLRETHQQQQPRAVIAREVAAQLPTDVTDADRAQFCLETLFVLKGWSGIVHRVQREPDLLSRNNPQLTLEAWLAAMLVSQHAILLSMGKPVQTLSPRVAPHTAGLGRLMIFQTAYEDTFAAGLLTRLAGDGERAHVTRDAPKTPPAYQALVCMDDREESFRRALESLDIETYGTVGFFGLDMRVDAVFSNRPTRQCPPVVEPSRTIAEVPLDEAADTLLQLKRKNRLSRTEGWASLMGFYQSRSLLRGVAASIGLGIVSTIPLLLKTWFPGATQRVRSRILARLFPHPRTRLALEGAPGAGSYSKDEQATIVKTLLDAMGLSKFAPIVFVTSHGSTTTNNPYRQAYGCGACSGNHGRPNARAFASMANDKEVRERLAASGLLVPDTTLFVPIYHDTTIDEIEFLDAYAYPNERRAEIDAGAVLLRSAAVKNAEERCLRLAPALVGNPRRAHAHVHDRGHNLAEPRPEYGHNRVGACIVGHRCLTKHLHLDRRTFLVSYDQSQDDKNGTALKNAVLGTVPVAANIALDYYYSRVDPNGFGAGSKLPLNVTSLLGVMTGSTSDLRLGLSRQAVELHEPMRPLIVVESDAMRMTVLFTGHPRLKALLKNQWFHVVRIEPSSGEMFHMSIDLKTDQAVYLPWKKKYMSGVNDALFSSEHDELLREAV